MCTWCGRGAMDPIHDPRHGRALGAQVRSLAVRHHAPADADVIETIAALAGPIIVEQMFSAKDRAAYASVPHGVTVVLADGTP